MGANLKAVIRHVSTTIEPVQSIYSFPSDIGAQARFRFLPIRVQDPLNFSVGSTLRNFGQPNAADGAELPTLFTTGIAYTLLTGVVLAGDFILPVSFNSQRSPAERPYGTAGIAIAATRFFDLYLGARIRKGDFRMSLGASINVGPLKFLSTYMIGPANGVNPADSLSIALSLDLLDRKADTAPDEAERQ